MYIYVHEAVLDQKATRNFCRFRRESRRGRKIAYDLVNTYFISVLVIDLKWTRSVWGEGRHAWKAQIHGMLKAAYRLEEVELEVHAADELIAKSFNVSQYPFKNEVNFVT